MSNPMHQTKEEEIKDHLAFCKRKMRMDWENGLLKGISDPDAHFRNSLELIKQVWETVEVLHGNMSEQEKREYEPIWREQIRKHRDTEY